MELVYITDSAQYEQSRRDVRTMATHRQGLTGGCPLLHDKINSDATCNDLRELRAGSFCCSVLKHFIPLLEVYNQTEYRHNGLKSYHHIRCDRCKCTRSITEEGMPTRAHCDYICEGFSCPVSKDKPNHYLNNHTILTKTNESPKESTDPTDPHSSLPFRWSQ